MNRGHDIGPTPVHFPVGDPVDPTPARLPDRQGFSGRDVLLRPVDPQRERSLFAATHGPGVEALVWTYLSYGPFPNQAAFDAWLEERARSTDPIFYTVLDRHAGTPVGLVSFLNIAPANRTIEMGHIWYVPQHQGGATNTEVAYLMMSEVFDRRSYRRLEWKCDALNARSRRAALRLGFRFEGIFRQHFIVKGRNRDTAWYSLLDGEWPQVKRHLEHWLYETPNDASGRRVVSLTKMMASRQKP